jgi:hypothetical protein
MTPRILFELVTKWLSRKWGKQARVIKKAEAA